MTAPVDLTPAAEHRGGAMYGALNRGEADVPRLRQVLAWLPQPEAAEGSLGPAADVPHWLRPDAPTSADRLGWTRPKLRTPEAPDRWTWLIISAHTQLRRARPLFADLRRPGSLGIQEPPPEPALPGPCAKTRPGPGGHSARRTGAPLEAGGFWATARDLT